jgi:TRAP-type C4-dicarboxylate transport system substrate-binding protein
MNNLKIGRLFLVLALALSIPTVAFAADIKLKIAGTWPAKHFGNEIMENMVKEIEAADVGLKVKYYPASQLGSGEELIEDAIRGNIDIVQAFIYAQADPRLEILNLPGLVTTFEELKSAYGDPNSSLNNTLREIMGDLGLTYLSLVGEGLIGVVADKKPVDHAGFGDKGMNIRVWSSDVAKKTVESIGYRATTMNWAEVLPALQSGVIDGAICCTPEWAYTTFAAAGIGKYFIPVNTFIEASAIYASQKTWDKMNQEQQDVVRAAAEKAAQIAIDKGWERSQGFVDQMKEAGYEILDYTPTERAAMVTHIKENVWPELAKTIGQETMDQLNTE